MLTTALQLMVLMLVFSVVEKVWPAAPERKWWRRPILVDICSWLVHPLSVSAGVTLAIGLMNRISSQSLDVHAASTVEPAITHAGFWTFIWQLSVALIVADFLWYWLHRAYHRFSILWAFHIVHHSSEELDWLSTARLHPVGQMFNHAGITCVLLLIGIPVHVIIGANIVIGASGVLTHANVRWTFGPFQYVLVSPIFHQWHHARLENGIDSHSGGNFGALFSFWDRLFGTWSMPSSSSPAGFGVQDSPRATLTGLFLHPFRVALGCFFASVAPAKKPSVDHITPQSEK